MKYLTLLFLLFGFAVQATCERQDGSCAPISQWEFSIAFGAGVHTNPLHGGDNIPLILVPRLSYYGDAVFFDNGMLGYTLQETQQFALSLVTELNQEKAYFTRWHPKNIFVMNISNSFHSVARETLDIKQVEDRDWALDAGVQLNWFFSDTTDLTAKILWDVSGVYKGYTGQIVVNHQFVVPMVANTFASIGLGAQVNSQALVDYYYGIEQQDSIYRQPTFTGHTSINPMLQIKVTNVISEQWRTTFYWKRKLLDNNTANSPLVAEQQIDTVFIGMEYVF